MTLKTKLITTLQLALIHLFMITPLSSANSTFQADDTYTLEMVITSTHDLADIPILRNQPKFALSSTKKPWTIIIFIAADNDLRGFAIRNLQQIATIGSNEYVNLVIHLDTRLKGNRKITKRFYVEKNNLVHLNANDPTTQRMDSGNPQTLISCCRWGISNFPADNYGLILWNHGTGDIDPGFGRIVNPIALFTFNETTHMLDLDRSISLLDFINSRGMCWDDSTGHYLTNPSLDGALTEICKLLPKKRFDFIGFDACLMAEIEIASYISKHASVMIGSQEVELGPGWHYQKALAPFKQKAVTTAELAKHIVKAFDETYSNITSDYTLSAINLESLTELEHNINITAILLTECLAKQKNRSVKRAIAASKHRHVCTHFSEPSYIDLYHLYANLQANIKHFAFLNEQEGAQLVSKLNANLEKGKKLITEIVIANKTGKHLTNAHGISIYFPDSRIHSSYEKLSFAQNAWLSFLKYYVTT